MNTILDENDQEAVMNTILDEDAKKATIDTRWAVGLLFVFIMVAQTVNFLHTRSNHKELIEAVKQNKSKLLIVSPEEYKKLIDSSELVVR